MDATYAVSAEQIGKPDPLAPDYVGTLKGTGMFEFSVFHWLVFVILVSPIVVGLLLLGLQKPVRILHSG